MRIKKYKSKNKYNLLILFFVVIVLVLSSLLTQSKNKNIFNFKSKTIENNNELLGVNTQTEIQYGITIENMIESETGLIYKDSVCSIYNSKIKGLTNIVYVYKEKPIGRQLTDHVFLHVYLKDNSKVPSGFKNIGFDHKFSPEKVVINGESYFYSSKPLANELVDISNIDYIDTGRYLKGVGRSFGAYKIKIKNVVQLTNNYKTIVLNIKGKAFEKIVAKRTKAISERTLITGDDDLVSARVGLLTDNSTKKADIRLKGDWIDHLLDDKKWSFRVKMKGEDTMFGMRKFSIQHPSTREYLWEWLFNKVVKEHDLIGLRYEFINTIINVKAKDTIRSIDLGIMAIEESFDKRLIENNNRREGVLLALDESYFWKERNKNIKLDLELWTGGNSLSDQKFLRVFNENKVLSTPSLLKQFNTAKSLVYEWKKGTLKISEVFDIDKLTFFVALTNLFGGQHGLAWHNIRFYYNPVTHKLEPISFDSLSGVQIENIKNYPLVDIHDNDPLYHQKLFENLELVSSQGFIQKMLDKYKQEMIQQMQNLNTEFKFIFDASILEYNSNFIKKQLSPSTSLITSLKSFEGNKMVLEVKNFSNHFPVKIKGLKKVGGKMLSIGLSSTLIAPNETKEIIVTLNSSFLNAFVSKKNKKGVFKFPNDMEKIKIRHRLQWGKNVFYGDIIPFYEFDETFLEKFQNIPKISDHDFLILDEIKKTITLPEGNYIVDKDVIIPLGYKVSVDKGFNLDLIKGASLISNSAINFMGIAQFPVRIYSSDSTGGGVFISGAKETSTLEHCFFTNLSNPNNEFWELSGAVNFNETDVSIKNCVFENSRCEDGLNIIRSTFSIDESLFKDTYSDAFDGDFVKGTIANSTFFNSGNDGIDVSGSDLILNNITIENSSDKAISAGENSKIKGEVITIIAGEIGIVSKDLSSVELDKVKISNTRLGLAVFQKKNEFGPGSITVTNMKLEGVELDYLTENNSSLMIDYELTNTVSNKVIDKMYGRKYGKSSK